MWLGGLSTDFEGSQIAMPVKAFIVHEFPRAVLVIHMRDVPPHLREGRMMAENPVRLNPPQHFIIASHEPFLLIAPVAMRRSHIGGDSRYAALFNALKAEVKGRRAAPIYSRGDAAPF